MENPSRFWKYENFDSLISQTINNIGLKNGFQENNCYINVFIQSLYHFNFLRYNLIKINPNESPDLLKEIISLLDEYSKNKRITLNPIKFKEVLDKYFKEKKEFQMNEEGDPVELLNTILRVIHNSINKDNTICEPKCFIHSLFYIDIEEKDFCSNCNFLNEVKYDSDYFIHGLNINSIIENSKKDFNDFKEKLIQNSNFENNICSKCNNNTLKINYNCNYSGFYLLFNLIWQGKKIDFNVLFQVYCMINSSFELNVLFSCTKNKTYKFLGMILFYINHYVSLFFEKKNNTFILYNDSEITYFSNWEEVIKHIIFYGFFPVAIFYENNEENKCEFNIRETFYNEMVEQNKRNEKQNKCDNNNNDKKSIVNEKENNIQEINPFDTDNNDKEISNYYLFDFNKTNNEVNQSKDRQIHNLSNKNDNDDGDFCLFNDSNNNNNGNGNNNINNQDNNNNINNSNKNGNSNNSYNKNNNKIPNYNDLKENKNEWTCLFCSTKYYSQKVKCEKCGRRNNNFSNDVNNDISKFPMYFQLMNTFSKQ